MVPIKTLFLCSVLFLPVTLLAGADQWSFGVAGGVSFTSGFPNETTVHPAPPVTTYTSTSSSPHDYIVGGAFEAAVARFLSVEMDALYRPLNFRNATSSVLSPGGLSSPANTVVTWEFPVLAKVQLPKPEFLHGNPFAEAGVSFRVSGNLNDTSPSNHGLTLGGGMTLRRDFLKISPQVRYTRWAADAPSTIPGVPRTRSNQMGMLVVLSH